MTQIWCKSMSLLYLLRLQRKTDLFDQ